MPTSLSGSATLVPSLELHLLHSAIPAVPGLLFLLVTWRYAAVVGYALCYDGDADACILLFVTCCVYTTCSCLLFSDACADLFMRYILPFHVSLPAIHSDDLTAVLYSLFWKATSGGSPGSGDA